MNADRTKDLLGIETNPERPKTITEEELARLVDSGEDISESILLMIALVRRLGFQDSGPSTIVSTVRRPRQGIL